eukprot:2925802-Alexandrium_andersonii.AAC.1
MKAGLDGGPGSRNRQAASSNPPSAIPQSAQSLAISAREARSPVVRRTFSGAAPRRPNEPRWTGVRFCPTGSLGHRVSPLEHRLNPTCTVSTRGGQEGVNRRESTRG